MKKALDAHSYFHLRAKLFLSTILLTPSLALHTFVLPPPYHPPTITPITTEMSLTPTPPGAAVTDYQKALALYTAGDTIGATRQALENLNKPFSSRYFQIKNLLIVGTLVRIEEREAWAETCARLISRSAEASERPPRGRRV